MKIPAPGLPLAALALLLAAAPAAAQSESGAFVIRLGRDTVAVEQYTRTADRIQGTLVSRAPRTTVRTYTAQLRPDGTVSRLEMTTRIPNAPALLPQTVTVTIGADSSDVRIARGDTVREMRMAAPADAFPWIFNSYALAEPVLGFVRRRALDSLAVAVVQPGAREAGSVSFVRRGADSVLIASGTGVTRARVDASGRVLGANSPTSTFKAEVERVASLDAVAMADDFARREAAGQAMGTLSPRDSVVATIGAAHLSVAYGRPLARGRRIMGQVVPYGEVWRTGANNATAFRTDRDLMFGDVRVPAGSYTLWTVPGPEQWLLVINKQTGQWGTEYHAEQDLARIPVRAERITNGPVEQFTMQITPGAGGGSLVLAWDDTRVVAPFSVAP